MVIFVVVIFEVVILEVVIFEVVIIEVVLFKVVILGVVIFLVVILGVVILQMVKNKASDWPYMKKRQARACFQVSQCLIGQSHISVCIKRADFE